MASPNNVRSDVPKAASASRLPWAIAAGLIVLTVTAYYGLVNNGFVHYDDNRYVTDNYHVQQGLSWAGLKWAFSSMYEHNWHPLTWLSHMADVSIFGQKAGGHHLVSLALHCLSVLLLFGFLMYSTGSIWASAFVATAFAIHPLHVQSVAWVAERKDVLSTFFLFAAIWMYAFYTRGPSWKRYLCVIVLYVLGLMSKPMLVTLPVILLALDYWPLQRFDIVMSGKKRSASSAFFGTLLLEKIPLLAIAAAASTATMVAQVNAMPDSARIGLSMRMTNAIVSYGRYIWEMIYPVKLGAFYPYPAAPMYWQAALVALALVGITAVTIYYRHRYKYLLAGWLWYVVTLAPVAGFIQVGEQSHADRYTYVPLVGLFILLAWSARRLADTNRACKYIVWLLAAATVPTMWVLTSKNIPYWKDDISLFGRAVAVTRDNHFMLANYGASLIDAGDLDKAEIVLKEALRLRPQNAHNLCNMGMVFFRKDKFAESLPYFTSAAAIMPNMKAAHLNAGEVLAKLNRFPEAQEYLQRAIELDQYDPQTYLQLGMVFAETGRRAEAIAQLQKAAELAPQDEAVRSYLRQLQEPK